MYVDDTYLVCLHRKMKNLFLKTNLEHRKYLNGLILTDSQIFAEIKTDIKGNQRQRESKFVLIPPLVIGDKEMLFGLILS